MISTAIVAWRSKHPLRRWLHFLMLLLVVQISLGATTVLLGLSRWASSIHLVGATLLWSGFILIALEASGLPRDTRLFDAKSDRKWRRFSYGTLLALLVQIALGGFVRHSHAGLACPAFPMCGEGFFPEFFEGPILAFSHRWLGVLMLGGYAHLWIYGKKSAKLVPMVRLVMIAVTIQIVLGIFTVWTGLNVYARAIHAANGYLLWGLTLITAALGGAFRATSATSRSRT